MISVDELLKVMPRLRPERAGQLLPHLNAAMVEFQINRPARVAAFLAQLAHESAELRHFEELASGEAYERRVDLGNTQPGDGKRYKGRGPIQLTGRRNYRTAGQSLGLPLEVNPAMAARPEAGFRIAGWYWSSRNLNERADRGDFDGITKAINGGLTGKASRDAYHARALLVFAPTAVAPPEKTPAPGGGDRPMPHLTIELDMEGKGAHLADKKVHHVVESFKVGGLAGGMTSGKPSVMMEIPLGDGSVALVETSLALFLTAADALRAKYGDPRA